MYCCYFMRFFILSVDFNTVNNILKDKRSSAEWASECVWYCAFVGMYDSRSQFVPCSLTFPLCRISAGNVCLGFNRDVLCHAVFVTCFRLALGTANSSLLIVFDLWISTRLSPFVSDSINAHNCNFKVNSAISAVIPFFFSVGFCNLSLNASLKYKLNGALNWSIDIRWERHSKSSTEIGC